MTDRTTLTTLGVDPDEEHVYRALLTHPGASASELGEVTGFGPRRLQRLLVELERKAMITRRGGAPARFQPAPSEVVVDALFSARQDELNRARLDAHRDMTVLRPAVEQLHVTELVEILVSREAVAERWMQLQQATRRTLEVFSRPPLAQSAPTEHEALQGSLLQQAVVVRSVYDEDALRYPGTLEHIRRSVSRGERARVISKLPLKLAVFDRRIALVPVTQDQPRDTIDGGLIVHKSALLDALIALFDIYWERATDVSLGDDELPAGKQLPADEDSVLTLLAGGLKDEAIAHELDLSVTTVRRRVATVQNRLGVTTRFQAGLALGSQGWPRTESGGNPPSQGQAERDA